MVVFDCMGLRPVPREGLAEGEEVEKSRMGPAAQISRIKEIQPVVPSVRCLIAGGELPSDGI